MNIQPVSRTVTDIVINLTEDEAREAIHTPEHLQTAIRKAFAELRKNGHRKNDIVLGKGKKDPKEKQIRASRPCQYCGKNIKNSIHEQKCSRNPNNSVRDAE